MGTTKKQISLVNIIPNFFKWVGIGFFMSFKSFILYIVDIFIFAFKGLISFILFIGSVIIHAFKGLYFVLIGWIFMLAHKPIVVEPVEVPKTADGKVDHAKLNQEAQESQNESLKLKMYKAYQNLYFVKKANEKKAQQKEKLLYELTHDNKRSDVPINYRYTAKDENGMMVTGIFTGNSKLDVNSFLVNEGYEVYSIENNKTVDFLYGQSSFLTFKMSNRDLIFWLTQLSTYVKAGITLNEAVKILAKQMGKNGTKRRLFQSLSYELTLGESFSKALEKQGNVFPSLLVNMIKAAEATGELEQTLDDMAAYYSEIDKTKKQMVSAMTYPVLVSVFALGVIGFIMLYVIPQFINIYDQAGIELQGLTLFIINLANFLKSYISYILIGVFLSVIALIIAYKQIKAFRKVVQELMMHLPVVGKIIIFNEITIFTKTFSSLLRNNVVITECIDILSKITNNELYKQVMYATITNITRGNKISDAFKDNWAVPEVAYYMIVTGESTGELAEMMKTVSNYYQEMHSSMVSNLKAFIEPIMIISLALVVGVVLIAVIMPMFNLYNSISI